MAPTLTCLLALVAADPAVGGDRVFAENPPLFRSQQQSDLQTGWTPADSVTTAYRSVHTSADDVGNDEGATPLGPVDLVLRGQNPTFVQPGVTPYDGQPGIAPYQGQPGIAPYQGQPEFLAPPGIGVQALPAPPMTMRYYAIYENVFLTPFFSQNTSSITTIGGGAGTLQNTVRQFSWDLEYSPRVEFGAIGPDGSGWRGRYWHFEHSTNDRITPAPFGSSASPADPISGAGIGAGTAFAPRQR